MKKSRVIKKKEVHNLSVEKEFLVLLSSLLGHRSVWHCRRLRSAAGLDSTGARGTSCTRRIRAPRRPLSGNRASRCLSAAHLKICYCMN